MATADFEDFVHEKQEPWERRRLAGASARLVDEERAGEIPALPSGFSSY
jgi:hypothetical protein